MEGKQLTEAKQLNHSYAGLGGVMAVVAVLVGCVLAGDGEAIIVDKFPCLFFSLSLSTPKMM